MNLLNNPDIGYEELEKCIKTEIPMTWYPALLSAFVEGAVNSGAFKDYQVHVFTKIHEERVQKTRKLCKTCNKRKDERLVCEHGNCQSCTCDQYCWLD